jgi:hypothetical protein
MGRGAKLLLALAVMVVVPVYTTMVREQTKERSRHKSSAVVPAPAASADSSLGLARQSHVAVPFVPPPLTTAPFTGAKRAIIPRCAFRANDGRKVGRVVAVRPEADSSTATVTVLVDPAIDSTADIPAGTYWELAVPAEARIGACPRQ